MSKDRPADQTAEPGAEPGEGETTAPRPYEPPRIEWEDAYEPLGFGLSCVKQDPASCSPGPTFS
jgi:hypothetical protein